MKFGLAIYDVFNLSSGTTILACDRVGFDQSWLGKKVSILSRDGEKLEDVVLTGEFVMRNATKNRDVIALAVDGIVNLSPDQVKQGGWTLSAPNFAATN